MSEVYLVQELYSNPLEYSSAEQKVPILRAVCSTMAEAAELVAKQKSQELQQDIDKQGSASLSHNLFIVKAPLNTYVDTMQLQRLNPTFNDLTEETRKNFKAVLESHKELTAKVAPAGNPNLRVDPIVYIKDRRAREAELMKRLNVSPMPPFANPVAKKAAGTVPQPAQGITVRPAGEVPQSLKSAAPEQQQQQQEQKQVSTSVVDILPGLATGAAFTGVVTGTQGVASSPTSRVTQ